MLRTLGVVATLLLLNACASVGSLNNLVKTPSVNYQSLSLGKVSSEGIELRPTFNLLNTNAFGVPVDSVSYTLSLDGKPMFNGQTTSVGTLQPNVAKEVTLAINLADNVLKSLQRSLLETKAINYKVAGQVKVMGVGLPFEHAATLHVPKVSIANVRVTKAGMNQVDMVLSLDIDNKNDFSLPLDNINYAVASAGKPLLSGQLSNQQIKHGNNRLILPLSVDTSKLVSSLFQVMQRPNIPLEIKVKSPLFNVSQTHNLNLSSLLSR